jgi:pSer/pThr/pTyr-binding forkhead associated (FHA) protein
MYGPPGQGFAGQAPGFDPGSGGAAGAPAPAAGATPGQQPMVLPANALRGFLVTYQTNTKGEFWPLFGGRVTVGRSSSGDQVDVPLADATISSRHAMIVVDGAQGTVAVEDTGSTNGTYVNEEHLGFNGRRELRDGDRVRFGGFTTIVKLIGRI